MKNDYMTYIALYVDDLLIISVNDDDLVNVKRRLIEKFEMKNLSVAKKFLEIKIEYDDDDSIKLHQNQYIQKLLKRHDMQNCNSVSTSIDTSIKLIKTTDAEATTDSKEYQFIVKDLMFAAIVIRSNIICAIEQLSQFNSNSFSKHLLAAKRVLRYLKDMSKLSITYSSSATCFVSYSNAD